MDHIKVDNEDLAQNEIDVFRLFSIFWSYKLHIVGITAFFSLISIVAILFLPVKFTSSALLAPVDSNNFTNRIAAGYGGLAGLAGVVTAARAMSAQAGMGMMYELDAIAAAVIGGTSLFGGRGRIAGTLFGVLILGVITSGFVFLRIDAYYQEMVKGAIIVGAVVVDQIRYKKKNTKDKDI